MVHTENVTRTWAAWIKLDKTQQAEAAEIMKIWFKGVSFQLSVYLRQNTAPQNLLQSNSHPYHYSLICFKLFRRGTISTRGSIIQVFIYRHFLYTTVKAMPIVLAKDIMVFIVCMLMWNIHKRSCWRLLIHASVRGFPEKTLPHKTLPPFFLWWKHDSSHPKSH